MILSKASISVLITALLAFCLRAAQTFYVETDGSATGDGSAQKPFATPLQARDAIRGARQSGTLKVGEAVTVMIGPGSYHLQESLTLGPEDSGTKEAPVTWCARRRRQAHLQGGITLAPESFKPVTDASILARLAVGIRDKVVVCDLAELLPHDLPQLKPAYRGVPTAPWLYVNQHPMPVARWPNLGAIGGEWAEFSQVRDTGKPQPNATEAHLREKRPGVFVFDDPRPKHWRIDEGVWLLGYWTHDWYDEVIRIAAYDPQEQTIKLAAPHLYGIGGGTWGAAKRRFFALNLLEELDAPGEWWLDRPHKKLYLYPAEPLKGANIVLATLTQPLVAAKDAQYIHFTELAFEYSHSADALIMHDTTGIEFAGCVVANHAGSGITINGRANRVLSCDLYHLGKLGIQLNGGDRLKLIPANNRAENNHIHHFGIFQRTYAPGIGARGCGQIVRHNCIHDAPHNAILYGGNEHLFERNEIYRVVMETGDAGAFYTGRDWTSQGNILRQNFIHNLGGGATEHVNTMGVYLDDCDCGDTLEGNVFWRAGRAIMIGGGRDNPIINNLVVDCPIALHLDSRGMTWAHWNNTNDPSWCLDAKAQALNYKQPPWSEHYPNLARIMEDSPREPLHNSIRDNIFVDCTRRFCDFDKNVMALIDKLEITNNLAVNSSGTTNNMAATPTIKGFRSLIGTGVAPLELGFGERSTGDLSLAPNARLLQELPSFKPIPFKEIGLYRDHYRRRLPQRQ